jgi:hypothetical protein
MNVYKNGHYHLDLQTNNMESQDFILVIEAEGSSTQKESHVFLGG